MLSPIENTVMDESLRSDSSVKRTRDEGYESSLNTPTSGPLADESLSRPEGVKKAKSNSERRSFGEILHVCRQVRERSLDLDFQILEFKKQKEARKWKQLELLKKDIQMKRFKMSWDILQQLLSKEVRTPWEEKMIVQLQKFIEQSKDFKLDGASL